MNKILVVGVGGAGSHLACHIQTALSCAAITVNTDKKLYGISTIPERLLIGQNACNGQSATIPMRGRRAAEESSKALESLLNDVHILVLMAGFGGGTGTGATPVIAKLAKNRGLHVVAGVTLPFEFEAISRRYALDGLADLKATGATVLIQDHALSGKYQAGESLDYIFNESGQALKGAVLAEIERSRLGVV